MKWIERHRSFLDFTLSSLLRRKWKNISLIVVYTLIVFLITSVLFFANAVRREAEAVLAGAPEMIVQKVIAGRHDLIPISYADQVKKIRGISGIKKVGHAGTLDPFATGVLLICLGKATKKVAELMELHKEYEGILSLGRTTDTLDPTGKIIAEKPVPALEEQQIQAEYCCRARHWHPLQSEHLDASIYFLPHFLFLNQFQAPAR